MRESNSYFYFLQLTIVIFSLFSSFSTCQIDAYFKKRERLVENSRSQAIGADLYLNPAEVRMNKILMHYKIKESRFGFRNPKEYLAGQHFFDSRESIENSCVYKILQSVPKGATLHAHDTSIVSDSYFFSNFTFRQNLYVNENKLKDEIKLMFFKESPGSSWVRISEIRARDPGFNSRLKRHLTLVRKNPNYFYSDMNSIWSAFEKIFEVTDPVVTYKPVFKDYFFQSLKELYDDNIRYVEFRGVVPDLYDLEGNVYGPEDTVKVYYDTLQEFKRQYPDFWGARLIFTRSRRVKRNTVERYIRTFRALKKLYPDFVAGFDIAAHEDLGKPLQYFLPQLLKLQNETKFFFHAAETLWNGQSSDMNLFDAVLLNTTRIGHGLAILKHPEVQRAVKKRKIAVEVCPISNQVLGFVRDLRNHPGSYLIANGYPMVISCDNPAFWGAKAMSFDWYMAFMAMANKYDDLRLLKQLALNSILYSAMEDDEKMAAMGKWRFDWNSFVESYGNAKFVC